MCINPSEVNEDFDYEGAILVTSTCVEISILRAALISRSRGSPVDSLISGGNIT